MNQRQQIKLPSILFQFLDSFFDGESDTDDFQRMLDYIAVTEAELRDPSYQFDGEQLYRMLCLLRKTSTKEPACFRALEHLSISHLGMAGIAGLTAFTLGDAFKIARDFHKYFLPFIDLNLNEGEQYADLNLNLDVDYEEGAPVITEIILGALKQFADEFTAEHLSGTITFSHAPTFGTNLEQTKALYESRLHCCVEFNSSASGIRFPKDYLAKRLKRQNPIMHSYAKDLVTKELKQKSNTASVTDKARIFLEKAVENELPMNLERLADELHMSARTLSRKLAKENTNFKTMLNDIRFEHAKTLLKETDTPIKQLAAKLGFANSDAFSRAFKAYTGETPLGWRGANQRSSRNPDKPV